MIQITLFIQSARKLVGAIWSKLKTTGFKFYSQWLQVNLISLHICFRISAPSPTNSMSHQVFPKHLKNKSCVKKSEYFPYFSHIFAAIDPKRMITTKPEFRNK